MTTTRIIRRDSLRVQVAAYFDTIDLPSRAKDVFVAALQGAHAQATGRGLAAWEQAPDFTLDDIDGRSFQLARHLRQGPQVLCFIRSPDNPICRLQLRAYNKLTNKLQRLGCHLIAITAGKPEACRALRAEENLAFGLLLDPDQEVFTRFRLNDSPSASARQLRAELADLALAETRPLPVPATFLLDHMGVVRGAHVDPNFTKRWEPKLLLEAVHDLMKHKN